MATFQLPYLPEEAKGCMGLGSVITAQTRALCWGQCVQTWTGTGAVPDHSRVLGKAAGSEHFRESSLSEWT